MPSDTVIFQHVLSKSFCAEWLALITPMNLRYCLKHGIDYQLFMADLIDGKVPGHWSVPYLIQKFIHDGYTNIIYLDADTIITQPEVDLRQAIVPNKIGAVWHNLSDHKPDWSHFNVGVLYVHNSMEVQRFVRQWLSDKPGSPEFPWLEQGTFNILGKQMDIINHLDNKWNAGHVSPSDDKVVWGLHGIPDRFEIMKKYFEELK